MRPRSSTSTPVEQQQTWQLRSSAAIRAVLAAVAAARAEGRTAGRRPRRAERHRQVDAGRCAGPGGGCLPGARRRFLQPRPCPVDAGGARETLTDAEVAASVFDWRRLRTEALEPLIADPGRRSSGPTTGSATTAAWRRCSRSRRAGWWCSKGSTRRAPSCRIWSISRSWSRPIRPSAGPDWRSGPDDPSWTRFWDRGEDYYFRVVRPSDGVRSPGVRAVITQRPCCVNWPDFPCLVPIEP